MKDSRHTGAHFEIACPDGFGCIEAIVGWLAADGTWHREAFERFADARVRLGELAGGDEASMLYIDRTVTMSAPDAIDTGVAPRSVRIEEGQWLRRRRKASPEVGRLRKAEREAFRRFEEADWITADRRLHEWLDAGRALREAEAGE